MHDAEAIEEAEVPVQSHDRCPHGDRGFSNPCVYREISANLVTAASTLQFRKDALRDPTTRTRRVVIRLIRRYSWEAKATSVRRRLGR